MLLVTWTVFPYRVWTLCGDSEMAEGSIWEAVEHAGKEGLDNLVVIVDVNRLGQRGETMHGWDLSSYSRRAEASGWNAIEIDGHDITAIDRAFTEAEATADRPTMIVARTIKGYGATETANVEGKHGQPLKDPAKAIQELGDVGPVHVDVAKPESAGVPHRFDSDPSVPLPAYEIGGDPVPTRKAFGEGLAAVMQRRGDVVALDGEVGNSTHLEEVLKKTPERYFEVYIAEQMLMSEAVGFQVRDWTPFASTFAAFLSRAYDFVRMAVISQAKLCINGSHAGVSIGEDGPSQMALEDLAEFRALAGSVVLYPSDPNQTAKLVEAMADHDGISYLRSTRSGYPTIYDADETFEIGGSKVVRESDDDQVTVIGAGVTLHEAIKAADELAGEGINVRVIDLYSVKPLDHETLAAASAATGGRLIVVEDHWPEGGIGDAVLSTFADSDERPRVVKLAVTHLPGSGKGAELLHDVGIDSDAIVTAAKRLAELGPQIGSAAVRQRRRLTLATGGAAHRPRRSLLVGVLRLGGPVMAPLHRPRVGIEHVLGRRRVVQRVVLAAHDVVRARHLAAADPPAAADVAVVLAGDRVGAAEQRDVGQRSADDVVAVGVVPGPAGGVEHPVGGGSDHRNHGDERIRAGGRSPGS